MASTGEAFGLFWDSENGDRTYSAASFEYWLKKFFTSGVFNGDLQVKATSGMTLEVEAGYTNADGKVKFWNAPFNVTLDAANSTYPRIDTVVIRRDNVNRQITCEKVTGAYSGDTPQPTPPTRNSEIFELVIAQIEVGAGVTGVTQSNITDTRPNNELCGYITGTVEELDFSAFTAQFEAYFAEFKRNQMADFQAWEVAQQAAYAAWFALVQQQQIQDKADWDAWYAALQEELHELPEDTAEYLQIEIDEIRTSGTTGSILKITTTETSLEGKTVTVTNGTETRTATFDENLECLISGYKGTGEVTISSSDGIQTATTVVTIPYFGNYQYAIAFWAATVNIQGDDNLKGATITVKDSDDLTVGTVVLNVITGRGVFTASKADTYTFNFTYQGTDYSESLVVDEETTYSLSLSAGFDWRGWVDTAQYLDSSDYNSLEEVLADEEAVRELCLEHACVDYLARVASATADVETIIENDLFAKWVNNSDYSLDILGANTAIKALMDAADKYGYGEWVLVGQVPKMTSNTTPYGEAIGQITVGYAYYPFSGANSSSTDCRVNINDYVGYRFTVPVDVRAIDFLNAQDDGWERASDFDLIYSDDGTTWETNEAYTNIPAVTIQHLSCDSVGAHVYWAIRGKNVNNAASPNAFRCHALQFYAWAPKGNVPIMTANNAPYGEVTSSGNYSSTFVAYKAFNGTNNDSNDCWISAQNSIADAYLCYASPNPICVKAIKLVNRNSELAAAIKNFKLQGSNDGTTWTDIATLQNPNNAQSQSVELSVANNDNYYLKHRILVVDAHTEHSSDYVAIGELQFYGRELSVSVPTMTANTTPYGEVVYSSQFDPTSYAAYKAFANDNFFSTPDNSITNQYIGYRFTNPVNVKKVFLTNRSNLLANSAKNIYVEYSNDGTNWSRASEQLTNPNSAVTTCFETNTDVLALYWRIFILDNYGGTQINIAQLQFFGKDYSEKEFEEGTTKKWLYDHGVELETMQTQTSGTGAIVTKEDSSIYLYKPSNGTNAYFYFPTLDITDYDLLRGKLDDMWYEANESASNTAFIVSNFTTTDMASLLFHGSKTNFPNNLALDVSSISGNISQGFYVGVMTGGGGTISYFSINELWLE